MIESDLTLKCYLIEPADKIIRLLSKLISCILDSKNSKYNLHSLWTTTFINLYNNRLEFLLMGEGRQNGTITSASQLFTNKFIKNYEETKYGLKFIQNHLQLWNNIEEDFGSKHIILDLDQKTKYKRESFIQSNKYDLLDQYTNDEDINKIVLETTILQLSIFVFQYVNLFEEESIKTNLWNYCLKSITFSRQCFLIGICTLISQYMWIGCLLYHVINNFEISNDPLIIIVTIVTTVISLLYSYISVCSYISSVKLYKFLLKLYDDYPSIVLEDEYKENSFYQSKNITMKKWHIKYNFIMDTLSNFILPLIIPILNVFIIINSETVVDAILNSVAVFFIIQIDEDLLSLTEYENEKNTIKFSKWIMASMYCTHFPVFTDIFKLEYNSWCSNVFRLSKRYKKNKVGIDKEITENPIF